MRKGMNKEKAWIKYVPFEEALREADFVSVHVPLLRAGESATPTYHLFNEKNLRLMKSTAYLVNTSRGPVVEEAALARALRENWIAGAALDVYESRAAAGGILRCAIRRLRTAAGCCRILPARRGLRGFRPIRRKGWRDDAFRD